MSDETFLFRAVESLRTGEMLVYVNQRRTWVSFSDDLVDMTLTVAQARALRDWLNLALPDDDAVYCKNCGERTDTYPIGSYHKCGATLP